MQHLQKPRRLLLLVLQLAALLIYWLHRLRPSVVYSTYISLNNITSHHIMY